jgi:hypothetical protein
VCGIVLFRAVIVMFVVVEIILVVNTCYTSVVFAAPICTCSRFCLWASQQLFMS